jgi:hypothetical protein
MKHHWESYWLLIKLKFAAKKAKTHKTVTSNSRIYHIKLHVTAAEAKLNLQHKMQIISKW